MNRLKDTLVQIINIALIVLTCTGMIVVMAIIHKFLQ